MVLKKQGFTLVELIVVVALVAFMSVMISAALNPALMVNKANDSKRKKDLGRIKTAFEEYFNDKGCYPSQTMVNSLSCEGNGFAPWLQVWPCDPLKTNYKIAIGSGDCPRSFKIGVNLQNRSDKSIPLGWYNQPDTARFIDGTLSKDDVNYGVSSSNISWFKFEVDPSCLTAFKGCYVIPGPGRCGALAPGLTYTNVYLDPDCRPECQVGCCYNGDICNQE